MVMFTSPSKVRCVRHRRFPIYCASSSIERKLFNVNARLYQGEERVGENNLVAELHL